MSMQPYNNIGTPLGGPVDDMMDDEDIDGLPEIDDEAGLRRRGRGRRDRVPSKSGRGP